MMPSTCKWIIASLVTSLEDFHFWMRWNHTKCHLFFVIEWNPFTALFKIKIKCCRNIRLTLGYKVCDMKLVTMNDQR